VYVHVHGMDFKFAFFFLDNFSQTARSPGYNLFLNQQQNIGVKASFKLFAIPK
jgi:hypothetical protein